MKKLRVLIVVFLSLFISVSVFAAPTSTVDQANQIIQQEIANFVQSGSTSSSAAAYRSTVSKLRSLAESAGLDPAVAAEISNFTDTFSQQDFSVGVIIEAAANGNAQLVNQETITLDAGGIATLEQSVSSSGLSSSQISTIKVAVQSNPLVVSGAASGFSSVSSNSAANLGAAISTVSANEEQSNAVSS